MNFASHYYFQNRSSGFYNAGLILADLIPHAQEKRFPLLLTIKKIEPGKIMQKETCEIINGILDHFEADRIFHQSQFFNYSTGRSEEVSLRLITINPLLHHFIVEICMDRYLLKNNMPMIEAMYDSFQDIFMESLNLLKPHLPIEESLKFLCRKFCENRIILQYGDNAAITRILSRISGNTGIEFDDDSKTSEAIGAIYDDIENTIHEYFLTELGTYRNPGENI